MAPAELYTESAAAQRNEWGRPSAIEFEEAAAMLDLEPWIVQRLRHPADEITSYLQLQRDAGQTLCIPFFQVLHNDATGQSIGRLSLAPQLRLEDCQGAAMDSTWQAALLGLPFGGASYGAVCDPADLSEKELIGLVRPLARRLKNHHRAPSCLYPGRGCCREFMGHLSGELWDSHNVGISGKPGGMAGIDSDQFTAEGMAAIVTSALRNAGKALIGARAAIQGCSARAQAVARRLTREGIKIVAFTDNSAGVYRPDGLILEDLFTRFEREEVLFGYSEAERIDRAEILKLPCDVLVLASVENQLNHGNTRGMAAVVLEAERNLVTVEARETLRRQEVLCVPWCLATAGALLAAYFERQQSQILVSPEELLAKCYGMVGHAFEGAVAYSKTAECSGDQAVYRIAIDRVASYLRSCGREH